MDAGPCSQYRLNAAAAQFGQCMCGHPKQAHIVNSENRAAAVLEAFKSRSHTQDCAVPDGAQSEPCSKYTIDITAKVFGLCRCGHPKEVHIAKDMNPAEAALTKLRSKGEAVPSPAGNVAASEPCSDFKVDTKSVQFGMCICGHPQDAHRERRMNPAEMALSALKRRNAQIATEEATQEEESAEKAAEICHAPGLALPEVGGHLAQLDECTWQNVPSDIPSGTYCAYVEKSRSDAAKATALIQRAVQIAAMATWATAAILVAQGWVLAGGTCAIAALLLLLTSRLVVAAWVRQKAKDAELMQTAVRTKAEEDWLRREAEAEAEAEAEEAKSEKKLQKKEKKALFSKAHVAAASEGDFLLEQCSAETFTRLVAGGA
eukprot:gnl/TRDRNA2_/TRDRNA2_80832_c0_seq1.p1 gnl/TRDRNA2_/TRDRNA2_80832_c0~~gnl/TRDRNA2_/TRDRNA2_80832_c0_seq1.p1  ORF type:complete len:391 (+),score=94.30 gnl/TRDRNA2_/TRDRNA2_80832_c0_seq1:50-1174(+)